MNSKTVLLVRNVAGDGFGGAEVYQLRLAEKLKENGFSPVIVTNSAQLIRCAKKEGFQVLKSLYLEQQDWSGWRNVLLVRYMFFQRKLKKWYLDVLRKYRPVAVNIQSRDDMISGTLACKELGIKVYWTDHADFLNWVLWNVNAKLKNAIGKKIIELSGETEKVIFVSERIAKETTEMIKPKVLSNMMIIENGVEDELEKYKGVKKKKDSFVFVGRVKEEKGIKELIEAFMMVVRKYPEAQLNLYGDGEIEKYRMMCKKCDRVKFHGRVDETLEVLAENETFVLPSYREGLSLSLLDAAMMRKKIIVSDVGGNTEVVANGKTGLLVPTKNIDKLAEAMIWMLENKQEAEKMAKDVRREYEEKFDLEKIFEEKMLPLYNNEKEKK